MSEYCLVKIDCNQIADWESFHDVFADTFGFPGFYGRNMDAWIDCMTYLDSPSDKMTAVHAPYGGHVVLQLDNVAPFSERCRDCFEAIIECSAFVNWRRLDQGDPPVLFLSFHK